MIGFGIDQVQAEYVADIRLRNINKETSSSSLFEASHCRQGPSPSLYFCSLAIRRDWGVIFFKYPSWEKNRWTG